MNNQAEYIHLMVQPNGQWNSGVMSSKFRASRCRASTSLRALVLLALLALFNSTAGVMSLDALAEQGVSARNSSLSEVGHWRIFLPLTVKVTIVLPYEEVLAPAIRTPSPPNPHPPVDVYSSCMITRTVKSDINPGVLMMDTQRFDALSRPLLTEQFDPAGELNSYQAYEYTQAGNIRSLVGYDRSGIRTGSTEYEYDGANRLTRLLRTTEGGTGSSVRFTYDTKGFLTRESEDLDLDGLVDSVSQYLYDEVGRRTTWSADRDNDGAIDQIYEYTWSGDLLVRFGTPGSRVVEFEYDAFSQLLRESIVETRTSNIIAYTEFRYDPARRIVESQSYQQGLWDSSREYEYDGAGRLLKVVRRDHAYGTTLEQFSNRCPQSL